MSDAWLVRVYNDGVLTMFRECAGPLELGRRDHRVAEELYQVSALEGGGCRIAIAPGDDLRISRRHARVEPAGPGRVLVRNPSESSPVVLEDGDPLRPGCDRQADLPVVLRFGDRVVRIHRATSDAAGPAIRSLDEPTAAPGEAAGLGRTTTHFLGGAGPLDPESVLGWLGAMVVLLQSAATDGEFQQKAARAVVEVVGLDMGRVLTTDGDGWKTVAFHPETEGEYERSNPPSRLVLGRVLAEKAASWLDPLELDEDCSSLAGVSSVVAAPVRARSGEVIAVLYGERRLRSLLAAGRPASRMDAMLMQVLAVGVATGLARVEQERAALAMQARFEQFFTPELAGLLMAQPQLLDGKDLEITVLFCDVRGFSRLARNQPPALTVEWTQDVLSTLSECVLGRRGVLVDYIGDEVVAMWGAPEEQPDHAELACRAALDMIGELEGLNARWRERLGEPMSLGIGLNTGMARVGNTGSRRKFKYGPLGDAVNVASRVQGACKYFKSALLVTRATRDRIGPGFSARRLGTARVVNIADPIELFELGPAGRPGSAEACAAYEEALAAFEAGEFRRATGLLGRLVSVHPDDGPCFALLARAIANLVDEPDTFDPAFRLPGK